MYKQIFLFLCLIFCSAEEKYCTNAFLFPFVHLRLVNQQLSRLYLSPSSDNHEARKLLEQAAKIRQQLAEMEGKTLEEVEKEAAEEKERMRVRLQIQKEESRKNLLMNSSKKNRQLLDLPETADDQTRQAAIAIERAFKDGITRQTVRLALVKENQPISAEEEEWPGGAKQMYREAGKPLTEALVSEIRAPAISSRTEVQKHYLERNSLSKVTSQDIWDFDGSGLVTSESASGPSSDVQALVFANTDVKYIKDVQKIDEGMGKERLFLLVNPFWRNVESWGFNLLAPNAKQIAQEVIFDCEGGGFQETYVLSRISVRGEKCVALKAYPYEWQLFAYIEDQNYGLPYESAIWLGSSTDEPTSVLFTKLLNERPEFKLTKTMRQMKDIF